MKLMQVGRWRLTTRPEGNGQGAYLILHYCEQAPNRLKNFGADGRPLKQSYSWVIKWLGVDKCVGCHDEPPAEMTGFVSMLEWER